MRKVHFLFLLLFSVHLFAQVDKKKEIATQMLNACEKIQGAKYDVITTERKKNGSITVKKLQVKLKTHPKQIYIYCIQPDSSAEVLWKPAEMKNEALVNPNGFPYINLKLDLYSSTLRKDDHHTIKELGFDYIYSMVTHIKNKLGDKFYSYLSIADTIQKDGRKLARIVFDYTDFAYIPYIIKKGENATTIAIMNDINEYMIVCANKNVKDFHDVKEGQQIVIPNCFGRKIIFGIDVETKLPLLQEVYDEKGLFERYELNNFILNPKFAEDEFTPDFKDYHF